MSEIIKQEYIHLHCRPLPRQVLQTASRWAAEAEIIADAALFLKGLWDREAEFSTRSR